MLSCMLPASFIRVLLISIMVILNSLYDNSRLYVISESGFMFASDCIPSGTLACLMCFVVVVVEI